jgi:hypothetical protein
MNTINLQDIINQRADVKLRAWIDSQIDPITAAIRATTHGTNWKLHEDENPSGWEYAKANGCTAYYDGPLKMSAFLHLREEWRRRELAEFLAKVDSMNATETP